MVRFYDYSPQQVIPAGASTVTVPYQALRGNNVIGFMISTVGAGNLFAANVLERVRVLVNTNVWWDVGAAALQNFLIAYAGKANLNLAGTDILLPFYDVMVPTRDEADMAQLPPGNIELQFTFGANTTLGSMIVGIMQTNVKPRYTTRLTGNAMNVPVGPQLNQPYLFSAAGVVRAVAFPSVGVDRAVLTLGGFEVLKVTGPDYTPAANLLAIIDAYETGILSANPPWIWLGDQYTAPGEGTQMLLDVSANWAGVANELTVYTRRELQKV